MDKARRSAPREQLQTGENSTKFVSYDGLVPVLLEAIKELKARVEALEIQ